MVYKVCKMVYTVISFTLLKLWQECIKCYLILKSILQYHNVLLFYLETLFFKLWFSLKAKKNAVSIFKWLISQKTNFCLNFLKFETEIKISFGNLKSYWNFNP